MIHDITHCNNEKCKDRESCYRWLAYQEIKQLKLDGMYSMFLRDCDSKCEDFMSKDRTIKTKKK